MFWAQFQNCVRHNRWDQSTELVYLCDSLNKDVASVLWDYGKEVTESLSGLTKILKMRFEEKKLSPTSIESKYETEKDRMVRLSKICIRTYED